MFIQSLALITLSVYGLLCIVHVRALMRGYHVSVRFTALAVFVLGLHASLLYHNIDVANGQNLTFFNVLSQASWLIAVLILSVGYWRPTAPLCTVAYLFCLAAIALSQVVPGTHVLVINPHSAALYHILLAIVTFSVLVLAVMQACLVTVQERLLLRRPEAALLAGLPALQVMEAFLFQLIAAGFILLSAVLFLGLYSFHALFNPALVQKLLLTLSTWLVFAGLLLGRHYYGWRGPVAIRYASFGVFLLFILLLFSSFSLGL